MKRRVLLLIMFLLPLTALADALPSSPYVQVSGHGTLTVVPDMAHVTLTVEKTDKNLATARADVEQRASQVIEAAKETRRGQARHQRCRYFRLAGLSMAEQHPGVYGPACKPGHRDHVARYGALC